MKSAKNLLAVLLTFVPLCSWMRAQQISTPTESVVPRLVIHTGEAKDSVINGFADATFAIYKESEGESPLWSKPKTSKSMQRATTPSNLVQQMPPDCRSTCSRLAKHADLGCASTEAKSSQESCCSASRMR
jgi:hypothetical protein